MIDIVNTIRDGMGSRLGIQGPAQTNHRRESLALDPRTRKEKETPAN